MRKLIFILFLIPVIAESQTIVCDGDPMSESASGFFTGAGFQQLYVLVNNTTGNIVATNSTGTFSQSDYGSGNLGDYSVYAVNSDDPAVITEMNGTGSFANAQINANGTCTDIIGPQNYTLIDCTPTIICDGDDIIETASGFFTGGSFQQLYVLVNTTSGNIVATNTTGTFTQANYGAGNIGDYEVYAVNTNDASVIAEINGTGSWATAQNNASGLCADIIGPQIYTINNCCDLDVTTIINNESCEGANDGSIDFTVNGSAIYDILIDGNVEFNDITASTQSWSALADGTYSIQIVDINDASCDTTFNVTINPGAAATLPTFNPVADICSGDALTPLPTTSINGVTGTWSPALDNTTTTTYTFNPTVGLCATNTALTITVNNATSNTIVVNLCSGANHTYADGTVSNNITINESYTSTLIGTNGCDSTVTENVIIGPNITNTITANVCNGDTYTFADGSTQTILANVSLSTTFLAANGCDSIVTEDITMISPVSNSITINICSGASHTYADGTVSNNVTLNESYTSTLSAANGCDSLVTEDLVVSPNITNTITTNVCSGDSYTFADGSTQTITANSTITTVLTASSGCDSILTEEITMISPVANTVLVNLCSGANHTYADGTISNNITSNESYSSTLIAANGCDSILTENVVIGPNITNTVNADVCNGASYTFANGSTQTITSNVSIVTTLSGASGCDSIVTENITMISAITNTVNFDVCENGTYTFADGSSQTITGNVSLTTTLTSVTGCDSIVTENITMLPIYTLIENVNACENSSYIFPDGTSQVITGSISYTSSLTTLANGCDSIVTTNITMNPILSSTLNVNVCQGENYTFADGSIQTITGNVSLSTTISSASGCDSIITENILMISPISNTITLNLCTGSNHIYADGSVSNNITSNESYTSTLVANNGCDSLVTENIVIEPIITNSINIDVCEGSTYTFADGSVQTITSNLSVTTTLTAGSGCDSIITENINVITPIAPLIGQSATYCLGDLIAPLTATANNAGALNWYSDAALTNLVNTGNTYTQANTVGVFDYYVTETILGCESPASQITITINDLPTISSEVVTDLTDCLSSNGSIVITANGISYELFNSAGVSMSINTTGSFTGLNQGTYYVEISNANCTTTSSSLIINDLTSTSMNTINNTVCSGATYTFVDGSTQTINSNTSYVSTLTNSTGCDSIITENISIIQPITVIVDTTICEGGNYTSIGDAANFVNVLTDFQHTSVLSSSNGCDSTIIENITIIPAPTLSLGSDLSVCSSESINITATFSNGTIIWSNGDTSNSITFNALNDTLIIATVTGSCGSLSDTLFIQVYPPPNVDAGADVTIPLGAAAELEVTGAMTYLWEPSNLVDCSDCPITNATTTVTTTYLVTGTDENGCSATDTIIVTIEGEIGIYIPNIFSPNNDGENDIFHIYGAAWNNYKLEIYNRWGGLVYSTETPGEGWTGVTNGGEECPQAVFVYKFSGTSTVGLTFERSGNVMLTR